MLFKVAISNLAARPSVKTYCEKTDFYKFGGPQPTELVVGEKSGQWVVD